MTDEQHLKMRNKVCFSSLDKQERSLHTSDLRFSVLFIPIIFHHYVDYYSH